MTRGVLGSSKQVSSVGAFLGGSLIALITPAIASAQLVPDATLDTQVFGSCSGTGGVCAITNGTTRGQQLFHSFQQFSLPSGDIASFIVDPAIQTLIVRVTGVGQPFISNINGVIATLDSTFTNIVPTNFFLLNPNGIVFGPNARFLVGGSVLATTADRLQFADGTVFSTQETTPLLTIHVPTGLQFGSTPGAIHSNMQIGPLNSQFQDVVLVGGPITLDQSILFTGERRLELASVGADGTVGLHLNTNRLNLDFQANPARQDIQLTNGAIAIAGSQTGNGEVVMTGRNIIVSNSSVLAGIFPGAANAASYQAGEITLNASDTLLLAQGGSVSNLVGDNAIGQGGNIRVTTGTLQIRDNAELQTATFGNGNAGNIQVMAKAIVLDEGRIGSQVFDIGRGNSGPVMIATHSLDVLNGGSISANTLGIGDAGDVSITANTVNLRGATSDGFASAIASQVGPTAQGNGGTLTIQTQDLSLIHSGTIAATTFGQGNAGTVQVVATTMLLDGTPAPNSQPGGISNQVGDTSTGSGGDIAIATDALIMTNGAGISGSTFGPGKAGNVRVVAKTLQLDGVAANGQGTGITSQVEQSGSGRGGNVTVEAGSLTLTNSAVISAATLGTGNAGNVFVTANTIQLDGAASNGLGGSGIGSQVAATGSGRGGDIVVRAGTLKITNGAGISAGTFGNGDAGNLWVTANTIAMDGTTANGRFVSGIGSQVAPTGSGRGGNVTIQTDTLTIQNLAVVSSSAIGAGSAGNLDITARTIQLDRGGIIASAASGSGANITLQVGEQLLLRRESQLSTSAGLAGTGGDGGNITINSPKGFIIGVKSENSDITANAFTGSGGRVNITAQGIFGLQFRPQLTPFSDITASSTFGLNGVVTLNTPNVDPSRGLVQLPQNLIDTNRILASSCIVRGALSGGVFLITGSGGLPERPGTQMPSFVTGTVQGIGDAADRHAVRSHSHRPPSGLQPEQPLITEAQGIYQLPDGQMILSWECPK